MECKWKINIVPCDKANKLIKVFSFPPCLADARVGKKESGIELFFSPPLPLLSVCVWVLFCWQRD